MSDGHIEFITIHVPVDELVLLLSGRKKVTAKITAAVT